MPCAVPVVGAAVIDHCGAVPSTVPTAVSPGVRAAGHHGPDSNANSKGHDCGTGGRRDVNVCWNHVGIAIDHGGVVHGNVNHLRIHRLNHDHLRRLLHHGELR